MANDFNDRQKLAFWLTRAALSLRAMVVERIADSGHDLTAEQYAALEELWRSRGEPATQAALAAGLARSPAAVSRLLDGLEEKGLIVRKAVDRRTNAVSLTPVGRELHNELGPILDAVIEERLSDVDAAALSTTIQTLKRVCGRD